MKKDLIRAALDWQNVAPDTECPIAAEGFTQQDLARAREDQVMSHNARITREEIELRVGLNNNGAVQRDQYDSAVKTNQQLLDAWEASLDTKELDNADPTDIWPVGQDTLRRGRFATD